MTGTRTAPHDEAGYPLSTSGTKPTKCSSMLLAPRLRNLLKFGRKARPVMAAHADAPNPPSPLACFYHVACMGNWKEVVSEQVPLLLGLDIHVTLLGSTADHDWLEAETGIRSIRRLEGLQNYETPTLQAAWEWSCANPAGAVLYLHTKGVSKPQNRARTAWRHLMGEQLVARWRKNLERLAHADMIGVNWCETPSPHFQGNFWMARAGWIARLPSPVSFRNRGGPDLFGEPWDRMHAEVWLASGSAPIAESLVGKELELWNEPVVTRILEETRRLTS